MSSRTKTLVVNAVGIVVLALGMFGIDVPPEQQAEIVAGIGAVGCVINSIMAAWGKHVDLRRANTFTWVGLWLAALILLVGCLAPKSPEEAIGRTYVAITSATEATIQAYEAGLISRDDAEEIWYGVQSALTITSRAQQALLEGGPIDEPLLQVQAILQVIHDILAEAQNEHE